MQEGDNAREHERLVARVSARYSLTQKSYSYGGRSFEIYGVADPDVVLQEFAEQAAAADDDFTAAEPYWAELWDASHTLCAWIATADVANQSVMDLGCGLGLTTALLASRQANVLAVDFVPDALEFCQLNSWPWRSRVRTANIDWRYDRLQDRFDLIVGADILYNRDHWSFVEAFWQHHLEAEGTIVVTEPGRHSADSFGPWLRQRGWHVTERIEQEPTAGRSHRQRLLEIVRSVRSPTRLSS